MQSLHCAIRAWGVGCAARALPLPAGCAGGPAGWDVLAALGRQEVGRGCSDMARVLGGERWLGRW